MGGYGPGSYYIWIYIQLWILMPFVYRLLNVYKYGIFYILLVCVLLNVMASVFCMSDALYRMLCIRYLFLSAIAWLWLHQGRFTKQVIVLSLLSLAYLLLYFNSDWSPLIFHGKWNSQNYPVYFWTYVLILLSWKGYSHIPSDKIKKLICWLGVNSWEIFLMQMFVLGFGGAKIIQIGNFPFLNQLITVAVGLTASISPIAILRFIIKKQ